MKKGYTHIDFLLDRTGSMESIKDDVIGGTNAFIDDQASEPGECTMSLTQFDSQDAQEVLFDFKPIAEATKLDNANYVPRSGTPLIFAMISRINKLGEKLAAMPEDERPEKVIFVVYTDGEENQSGMYEDDQKNPIFTTDKLKELVEKQSKEFNWIFSFLGADQDAFAAAGQYGFGRACTMSVGKTGLGTRAAYLSMSSNIKGARRAKTMVETMDCMSYSDDQRSVQDEELAKSGKGDISNL